MDVMYTLLNLYLAIFFDKFIETFAIYIGGELLCCSKCPYAFCEKCVLRNFSSDGLKQILSNDNWKCYACTPKILYPLRAQHWALVNYIKKQQKYIPAIYKNCFELILNFRFRALNSKMSKGLRDQDKISYHMKKDASICCPSKTTAPKRRRRKISSDEEDESSDAEIANQSKKIVKTNATPRPDFQKNINSGTCYSAGSESRNKVK